MHLYEVIAWIYHVNTGGSPFRKGFRNWLWFCKNPEKVYIEKEQTFGQFRCLNDKRLIEKIQRGDRPIDFDWWVYEIVRNVHKEKTAHPCQLPSDMVSRIVKMCCPEGGLVLDPFCGSGTTAVVARENKRHFITTEIDVSYCKIARDRLRKSEEELF